MLRVVQLFKINTELLERGEGHFKPINGNFLFLEEVTTGILYVILQGLNKLCWNESCDGDTSRFDLF